MQVSTTTNLPIDNRPVICSYDLVKYNGFFQEISLIPLTRIILLKTDRNAYEVKLRVKSGEGV